MADDEAQYAQPIAELQAVLLQMMAPPALHPVHPANAVLQMERSFENCFAELETHCNVAQPEQLTLFKFLQRCDYFEKMMTRDNG